LKPQSYIKNRSKLRKSKLNRFNFGILDLFWVFEIDEMVYKYYKGVGEVFLN